MTLRKKVDDDGTCFDYFGSGGCGYVPLNLKGGNPLEGDGDPYPGWPSYCYPHLFPVVLGQVCECAKKVPDYWVGTAVQKY